MHASVLARSGFPEGPLVYYAAFAVYLSILPVAYYTAHVLMEQQWRVLYVEFDI